MKAANPAQAQAASHRTGMQVSGAGLEVVLVVGRLLISTFWLAGGTHNPFIYFRF